MNKEQTIRRLIDGLYHRPYTTTLSCEEVQDLADKLNIKVETIEINSEHSQARCTFEVKPW